MDTALVIFFLTRPDKKSEFVATLILLLINIPLLCIMVLLVTVKVLLEVLYKIFPFRSKVIHFQLTNLSIRTRKLLFLYLKLK